MSEKERNITYHMQIEELTANAIIKKLAEEKPPVVSFVELDEYAENVQKNLKNIGISSIPAYNREATQAMLKDHSDILHEENGCIIAQTGASKNSFFEEFCGGQPVNVFIQFQRAELPEHGQEADRKKESPCDVPAKDAKRPER